MNEKDYFIPKMFKRLLYPSLFSSLGFAAADIADALVVGQKMGETGLAAISLCLPVFMLINFFMDGLGLGGSIRYAGLLGKGKAEEAVKCFNRIVYSALFIGILIGCMGNFMAPQVLNFLGTVPEDGALYTACEEYMRVLSMGAPFLILNVIFAGFLRNDNNAGLAAAGFLIGNALDLILNFVLVLGCGMGTRGAALSTVIGSIVAISCYTWGILSKKTKILKLKPVKYDFGEVFSCFGIGFSTSVRHLFQLAFFVLANHLLMKMGKEEGVSIFEMVFNASLFIIYIYNGTAEAMQPMVSTFAGENNEADCRSVLAIAKRRGILAGGLVTLLVCIFARKVASMFGLSEQVIPMGVQALRIYCIGFAFAGLNILNENYYQAKEDGKSAFLVACMRELVILFPCTLLFSELGIPLMWLLYPVTELITMVLFWGYRRLQSKKEQPFDENRILRMSITKEQKDLSELLEKSERFCEKWDDDIKRIYFVTLIMEEICTSIIRNALEKVPDGRIRITLLAMENGDFMLHILDNAVEFNPFSLKARKIEKDREFDIDGVSMTLIRKKSKEFMHRECQGFNSLVIRI